MPIILIATLLILGVLLLKVHRRREKKKYLPSLSIERIIDSIHSTGVVRGKQDDLLHIVHPCRCAVLCRKEIFPEKTFREVNNSRGRTDMCKDCIRVLKSWERIKKEFEVIEAYEKSKESKEEEEA